MKDNVFESVSSGSALREVFYKRNFQFISKFKQIHQNLLNMNAENGYASEGSSKEYQTDSSPGPSTGKQRQRKRRRNMKYSSEDFQGSILKVHCGNVKGVLYKEKLAAGVCRKSIKDSQGKWVTPGEFEASGNRARWKTWKKSITCKGFPLEKLIEERDLRNPPREYRRKKRVPVTIPKHLLKRKNPPRLSRQIAEFQLSDAAQETLRVPKKRTCKYHHIISSSSSSSDASPTTPTVVCDDNLGGATLSPSPVLSSEAVPETIQPKPRPSQLKPRVILKRLPSTVPRASSNLLVSPQMDPKPAHRTIRRNPCPCQNLMVYPLTSSLGRAILSGQHRMEQLFRNTLGNRPMVQKKLQDILGHLGGLKSQQKHLLAALKTYSRCNKDLDVVDVLYKKMDAILNHQQMLQTSVVQFMKVLGVEEPKP